MTRRGDPVEMTRVQWHESTGSIKDVDGHRAAGIGMADRCGEHSRQPELGGQTQQSGGVPEAGGCALRPAMAHHLDDHTTAWQQVDPLAQQQAGPVGTARQQGPTHVRARPEEDHQSQLTGPRVDGMLRDELGTADGCPPFTAEVSLGHQTAQPAPTNARVDPGALPTRQHRDPWVPGINLSAAPGGSCATSVGATGLNPLPCNGVGPRKGIRPSEGKGPPGSYGQVHTEHWSDAGLVAGLHKAHSAIEPVAIG